MTFFSSLSAEDVARYFRLIEEVIGVRRHIDLLIWLQGDVQHYLPHEIMVCAWGDFDAGEIRHDVVSALPGVRTAEADLELLSPLLSGMYDRWNDLGKKPYVLRIGECGFVLAESLLAGAFGDALLDMRTALVHGIGDERGGHECLYVTFSSRDLNEGLAPHAIKVLLPYLDAAQRRIAHLPSVAPVAPVQEAPPPEAAGHGLSQREIEILGWIKMGKTNEEIGMILGISAFTVKNHVQRIFKKLDVSNRIQAVAKFERATQ